MSRESTVKPTEQQIKVIYQIVDALASAITSLALKKIDHDAFIEKAKKLKGELFFACVPQQAKIKPSACCARFPFSKEENRDFSLASDVQAFLLKHFTDVLWGKNVLCALAESHPDLVEKNPDVMKDLDNLGEAVVSPKTPFQFGS